MNNRERKFIFIILFLIIVFSFLLIFKIKSKPKYKEELYAQIYSEYAEIFEEEKDENNNSIKEKNVILIRKNSQDMEYKVIGKITIPKIDIQYPIINERSEDYLKIAPAKLCGPEINEKGNLCIVGHNYKNNQFFSRLSELEKEDKVYIAPNKGKEMTYLVFDKYEVEETDMECTSQETNDNIELTLITCTSNKKKRLVVKCRAIE